jgi:hypothetical protein
MTHDHTGHAASGCNSFELMPVPPRQSCETPVHLQPVRWLTPKERNKASLIGVVLCCEDCGEAWAGLTGGWQIEPGGAVYCNKCKHAEAGE